MSNSVQIPLDIIPRLPYVPGNFVIHKGVEQIHMQCLQTIEQDRFSIIWIEGDKRSGKTHLAVRICDEVIKIGKFPRLLELSCLEDDTNQVLSESANSGEVVIVDDVDRYLNKNPKIGSGEFVNFVEGLRLHQVPVIFLSGQSSGSLPCDEHVMSRIRSGMPFKIGAPDDGDLVTLIKAMAHQRGFALSENRISFISRRVRRDLASIEEYFDRVQHLSSVLSRSLSRPLLSEAL